MKLSIISAVSRDDSIIRNFLSSIYDNTDSILYNIEIILCAPDNIKSKDWSDLKSNKIELKILESDELNPMQKRNAGIIHATGDIIAIVDDDIKFTINWFDTVYSEFKDVTDDKFILTGPSNLLYDNSFSQKLSSLLINNFFYSLRNTEINSRKAKIYFMDAAFCNCVFPKSVINAIGLLDEKVNFYLDDTLFFYKADSAGIPIYNHPNLIVAHKRKEFPSDFFKDAFKKKYYLGYNYINYNYLYRKDKITNICSLAALPCLFIILNNYFFLVGGAVIFALFAGITAYWRQQNILLGLAAFFLLPFSAVCSVLFFYVGIIKGIIHLLINKQIDE